MPRTAAAPPTLDHAWLVLGAAMKVAKWLEAAGNCPQ